MRVCAPTWFIIMCNCVDGAPNLWKMVSTSRYLLVKLKAVVDPVLQRNAYFAHPENVILSMLTAKNKGLRVLGCRRIINTRVFQTSWVKEFIIPQINFNCSSYIELSDWKATHNSDRASPPEQYKNGRIVKMMYCRKCKKGPFL